LNIIIHTKSFSQKILINGKQHVKGYIYATSKTKNLHKEGSILCFPFCLAIDCDQSKSS
jgi:hypothetical protein